ncbi:hypothetical protein SEA_COMRADE_172 [Streptomyces phage Comrade]|uniref:Uncharacterized protein n=3 Tax=Gilsonvirus comrade TaxID=2846395 RepID=A0A345ME79_9CAUD|nr:hypothetical protein HWB84_gp100 [Streptomyces phage Comrade]AXH68860.1 hypothetical protein SEA_SPARKLEGODDESS_175 [Streptomyces phage SparkleGoddess]QQO39834.1 hypothetical protein SEA_BELFORT_175 [Streptomyces phage Belfort]QZE11741.1 hypothetical protein SEA_KARP_169 [Streptomyces phage Karp]UTN92403.1 hypothetical protein SEA_STIGMA_173 [Streptomyces phage Stigma]AXQ63415.1 hypothetical protein SEA_COMRADE_172 [Streptomyces phage Comrade]
MRHRLEEDRDNYPLIYIIQEGVWGFLVQENAFYSQVKYSVDGFEYNTSLDNDEFIIPNQIGYERG